MGIGSPIRLWVVGSNNCNVPSPWPVAMMVPVGFQATARAKLSPVVIGSPIGLWVVASNSRSVPSTLPVVMMVPVRVPGHRGGRAGAGGDRVADRVVSGGVGTSRQRAVVVAGGDDGARRAEQAPRWPCRCRW